MYRSATWNLHQIRGSVARRWKNTCEKVSVADHTRRWSVFFNRCKGAVVPRSFAKLFPEGVVAVNFIAGCCEFSWVGCTWSHQCSIHPKYAFLRFILGVCNCIHFFGTSVPTWMNFDDTSGGKVFSITLGEPLNYPKNNFWCRYHDPHKVNSTLQKHPFLPTRRLWSSLWLRSCFRSLVWALTCGLWRKQKTLASDLHESEQTEIWNQNQTITQHLSAFEFGFYFAEDLLEFLVCFLADAKQTNHKNWTRSKWFGWDAVWLAESAQRRVQSFLLFICSPERSAVLGSKRFKTRCWETFRVNLFRSVCFRCLKTMGTEAMCRSQNVDESGDLLLRFFFCLCPTQVWPYWQRFCDPCRRWSGKTSTGSATSH